MKICFKHQSIQRKNAENCIVTDYPISEATLDFAIVKVNGRYPAEHYAINQKCKEIVHVQEGFGKLIVNGFESILNQGDTVLIEAGEKFYWDGKFTLFISCNPAFTVEQHQLTE